MHVIRIYTIRTHGSLKTNLLAFKTDKQVLANFLNSASPSHLAILGPAEPPANLPNKKIVLEFLLS